MFRADLFYGTRLTSLFLTDALSRQKRPRQRRLLFLFLRSKEQPVSHGGREAYLISTRLSQLYRSRSGLRKTIAQNNGGALIAE